MCLTLQFTAKSMIGLKYLLTSDNCGGRNKKSMLQYAKAGLYVATSVKSKCRIFTLYSFNFRLSFSTLKTPA